MLRKLINSKKFRALVAGGLVIALAVPSLVFAAAYDQDDTDTLWFRGSTTLAPITQDSEPDFVASSSNIADFDMEFLGSTTGIKALLGVANIGDPLGDPQTDIGQHSRPLKANEEAYGVLEDTAVGLDGLAFVVGEEIFNHATNPVTDITIEEIADIYEGVITNWNQLGGPNQSLTPRARDTNSGTRDSMLELCDIRVDEATTYDEVDTIAGTGLDRLSSNGNMVAAIAGSDYQFGYCGLGYIDDYPGQLFALEVGEVGDRIDWEINSDNTTDILDLVMVANELTSSDPTPGWIREDNMEDGNVDILDLVNVANHLTDHWTGVFPSNGSVQGGTYPVARYLWMSRRTDQSGDEKAGTQEYLTWILSSAGQQVVEDAGFIPLP